MLYFLLKLILFSLIICFYYALLFLIVYITKTYCFPLFYIYIYYPYVIWKRQYKFYQVFSVSFILFFIFLWCENFWICKLYYKLYLFCLDLTLTVFTFPVMRVNLLRHRYLLTYQLQKSVY